jgi:hypothetical protein
MADEKRGHVFEGKSTKKKKIESAGFTPPALTIDFFK